VYQHVLAWREALGEEGIDISVWRIHRKIGMSGGLLTNMLLRETGFAIDPERIERLRRHHAAAFARHLCHVQPLPGARELLSYLTHAEIPWAIATSGRMETARFLLDRLEIDCNRIPGQVFPGGCQCANGDCGRRRIDCNHFRYGQCNTQVQGTTEVVCRLMICQNPATVPGLNCNGTEMVDDNTCNHEAGCLEGLVGQLPGGGGS